MDERSANRIGTNEPVESISGGRRCAALMYDVSTGGCAVETVGQTLTRGAAVTLRVKDLDDIDGTVAWQIGLCAGIEFTQPLHADVVMYLGFKDRADITRADLNADQASFAQPTADAPKLTAELLIH
ncbi:MAG: PilZ domain-containing protein [Croceibacterium sp.]